MIKRSPCSASIDCKGFIDNDFEIDESCVTINCEDAWGPKPEVWDIVAGHLYLTYEYIAEEPGCELYINTSRRVFPEYAKIEIYENIDSDYGTWLDSVYAENDEEVLRILNEEKEVGDLTKVYYFKKEEE